MFTQSRRWTRSFRSHFSVQHCIPRHDAGCLRFREKPEGSPARQDDCRLSLQPHNLLLRRCLVLVWGRTCTDTRSKEFLISPTFLPHVCLFKAAERGGGGCILSGYLIQYFFLAFFFSLNAIAINIYLPFSKVLGSLQKVRIAISLFDLIKYVSFTLVIIIIFTTVIIAIRWQRKANWLVFSFTLKAFLFSFALSLQSLTLPGEQFNVETNTKI